MTTEQMEELARQKDWDPPVAVVRWSEEDSEGKSHPMEGPEAPEISKFLSIAIEMGNLVTQKNAAYGDSFARSGEFLKLLYPNGARPDQYNDMLAFARMFDKFSRIATDENAFGEDPARDLVGYSILMVAYHEAQKQEAAQLARINEVALADTRSGN